MVKKKGGELYEHRHKTLGDWVSVHAHVYIAGCRTSTHRKKKTLQGALFSFGLVERIGKAPDSTRRSTLKIPRPAVSSVRAAFGCCGWTKLRQAPSFYSRACYVECHSSTLPEDSPTWADKSSQKRFRFSQLEDTPSLGADWQFLQRKPLWRNWSLLRMACITRLDSAVLPFNMCMMWCRDSETPG